MFRATRNVEDCQHGFAVIEGWRFPITKLEIRHGRLLVTCARDGPVPHLTGPVTIFGSDGLGFIQGGTGSIAETTVADTTEVTISLVVESVNS